MEEYQEGDLIIATKGGYSDYCLIDTFICLKPFIKEELVIRYCKENPYKNEVRRHSFKRFKLDDGRFIKKLVRDGFIKIHSHKEFYLGSYDDYDVLIEDYNKLTQGINV